ncbi:MAG: hypothetical protein ACKO96_23320 [Flammeovirgaceae bacterium]
MTEAERLERINQQTIASIKSQMADVASISSGLIFSDNGLPTDKKKEIHTVITSLTSGNATPDQFEKAKELMKELNGK